MKKRKLKIRDKLPARKPLPLLLVVTVQEILEKLKTEKVPPCVQSVMGIPVVGVELPLTHG
jgi:hypothetical protein